MTEVATEGYATIRTTIMIAATSSSPRTSQVGPFPDVIGPPTTSEGCDRTPLLSTGALG